MTLIMSGVAGMTTILLLLFRKRQYNISWTAMVGIIFFVGIVGYLGAALASFLSYNSWTGIRFYGKAVFATIALYVVSKVLKSESTIIMDYYAPVDIAALIVMKMNCMRAGCCSGIELYLDSNGQPVLFPSQQVELIVAFVLFSAIIIMECTSKFDGYRYSIYLLVYGVSRYILDMFRADEGNAIDIGYFSISICQLFCCISMCLGIVGIYTVRKRKLTSKDEDSKQVH